jgi:hypothetical protein
MVNFGDVGRICLNQEIRGVCESCLWWEWDAGKQRCANAQLHVCPVYRDLLFNVKASAGWRRGLRSWPQLAGAGSKDQPAAPAGESGIS